MESASNPHVIGDKNLEQLLGIVTTRKYFLTKPTIHDASSLKAILKKPYYVPETTRASALLRSMREQSENLAIVVDEYGSISGLISQEDLIEEVIGEISDQRDAKSLYTRSNEDVIIASGKLELSTFEEVYEPYLILQGFIKRTPRGREATELACQHLKKTRK